MHSTLLVGESDGAYVWPSCARLFVQDGGPESSVKGSAKSLPRPSNQVSLSLVSNFIRLLCDKSLRLCLWQTNAIHNLQRSFLEEVFAVEDYDGEPALVPL
jgi:hypothetical protein